MTQASRTPFPHSAPQLTGCGQAVLPPVPVPLPVPVTPACPVLPPAAVPATPPAPVTPPAPAEPALPAAPVPPVPVAPCVRSPLHASSANAGASKTHSPVDRLVMPPAAARPI